MSRTFTTRPSDIQAWDLASWSVIERHHLDCGVGRDCDITARRRVVRSSHPTTPTTGCRADALYYGGCVGGARQGQHAWANIRERQARAVTRKAALDVARLANAALHELQDHPVLDELDVFVPRRSIAWDLW